MNQNSRNPLESLTEGFASAWQDALGNQQPELRMEEIGTVRTVQTGVATVSGLPGVKLEELVELPGSKLGMAFDLSPDQLGVILLDESTRIETGDPVRRTGRVMDLPVGEEMLGRIVDPLGRPRDDKGPVRTDRRRPLEQPAPGVLDRSPVQEPLQTGIKVIDALVPIGRGQRELIIGDRQTGKTSLAVDAILNQSDTGVLCIYCAIGQRASSVASVIEDLRSAGAMDYTSIIVASGDDPAALRWAAPYAAMSLGEHFMQEGRDVLVVLDDLTQQARSYRELSLLLRRPPGREAFPGDIFYIHSRLLERSTHLRDEHGGGSLTALPIIETQAQNISAYIPTNLISITDGQVYLDPDLFRRGQLPPVDVGRSVSRVGGKAQLPAFRQVTGDLRLAYSQFEELERFSRYGTRLQEKQRLQLEHGRRVRHVLRQDERNTFSAPAQVAILLLVTDGLLDELAIDRIDSFQEKIRHEMKDSLGEIAEKIRNGEDLTDQDKDRLRDKSRDILEQIGKD